MSELQKPFSEDEILQQAMSSVFPTGTPIKPVNNIADAVLAAAQVVDNPIAVIPTAEAILVWIEKGD